MQNEIPRHEETRRDYGFDKAAELLGGESEIMLCSLFRSVFLLPEVTPEELHQWRMQGRLVQRIKDAFNTMHPECRGHCYPWFLQHQALLDDSVPVKELLDGECERAVYAAWMMTGGSPGASLIDIHAYVAALPPTRNSCYLLYCFLAANIYPDASSDEWVDFGFVSTFTHGEAISLSIAYRTLVNCCSFQDFCVAFESSAIPALFERYGLGCSVLFYDVMSGHWRKSVWDLKHRVDQLATASSTDPAPTLIPSVFADYGYMNCRDATDAKRLDSAYRRYFAHPSANALDLHRACIQGRLSKYLGPFMQWKKRYERPRYVRLLKNMYPVRNFPAAGLTAKGPLILYLRAGGGRRTMVGSGVACISLAVVIVAILFAVFW
ncbi:hypothetical protein BV20DRAFT_1051459 [Pilatotrama ljubarskyi]|nr:hypothetical protein BV20DRAFT_1051459 [Pilatotrama ljubarskyi]